MAEAESLLDGWSNIPPGSTLHVTLEPETGFALTGTHTINTANGPVLSGPIAAAHFPLEIPIGSGDQHIVDFTLRFAGAPVDVEVVAHVEEPDGSRFQDEAFETARISQTLKSFLVNLFANG